MLKSYFTVAIRNLFKNKIISGINIGGLAIGMAAAMVISLWIYDELSFNRSFENYEQIAQVESTASYNGELFTIDSHPMPLGTLIKTNYPADFSRVVISTQTERHIISTGQDKFSVSGRYMQAEAAQMLTLQMLKGSRNGLNEMSSVLLSATEARKIFGDADPVGKSVKLDNQFATIVTGVYKDLPENSEFSQIGFIAPFDFYLSSFDWARKKSTDWNNIAISIYVQLKSGVSPEKASADIRDALGRHVTGDFAKRKPVLFLHPMSEWHLYSKFEHGVQVTSDQLQYVRFYAIIGSLILLLACINFMNLTTARAERRAKEVGIRKAIGSLRGQLIAQFFSESMTVAAMAFALAIVLVQLSLPLFNVISGKQMAIPFSDAGFWLAAFGFILITGLLAGSYPALYLSSFNPVKVLKGSFRVGRFAALPRKALVILQFSFSIMLAIGTIVVYRQIKLAKDRPVGYSNDRLLQIPINSPEFQRQYPVFADELKSTGVVSAVAESASPATSVWSTNTGFSWGSNADTKAVEFATIAVTGSYGKTVGWQFISGRDFSASLATDSTGFVLNETAAKLMGITSPNGQTIIWDQIADKPFKVLGVIKDMVMESPFMPAYPTIFFIYNRDGMNCVLLKLNQHINTGSAIQKIESVFKRLYPETPFEYSFVNEDFSRKFAAEERTGKLAGIFSGLAILISCLGLFALASFVAEQRTKEIGVRKVLGASVFGVWRLIARDFVMLVLISLFIATPVAYFFMSRWLANYQYRTSLSWWIFALAGVGALAVTMLTVSFQSVKAAMANPVKSLKTE